MSGIVNINGFSVKSPLLQSAILSPVSAGAGHIAGGTTANLFAGQSFNEAFNNSFKGLGKSMAFGGALGVSTTAGVCFAKGINPLNGKNFYPKNNGFLDTPEFIDLQPGQVIDRYGDETGRFFSPEGTPIENRSLHPSTNTNSYNSFEVVKPFPVQSGTVAPYYGQPGGGVQFYSPNLNTQQLLNSGFIIRFKF